MLTANRGTNNPKCRDPGSLARANWLWPTIRPLGTQGQYSWPFAIAMKIIWKGYSPIRSFRTLDVVQGWLVVANCKPLKAGPVQLTHRLSGQEKGGIQSLPKLRDPGCSPGLVGSCQLYDRLGPRVSTARPLPRRPRERRDLVPSEASGPWMKSRAGW